MDELTLFPSEFPGPARSRPEHEAVAPAPLVRVRLLVAYHGGGFHGFAVQAGGVRTVAGALGGALELVARQPAGLVLTCAGRTDTGVHAWGQVVHADLAVPPGGLDPARLQRSLNKLLAPEIVVRALEVAPPGFDARYSASWRRYRYTVCNRALPDPFLAATAWHVPQPLHLAAMRLACDPFLGEHDFTSFCRAPRVARGEAPISLVRTLLDAEWHEGPGGLVRFEVRATAFCHRQVRSMVGFLVDVGLGRRRPGEVLRVLEARERAAAGTVAPSHGLCLWEVGYPPALAWSDPEDRQPITTS